MEAIICVQQPKHYCTQIGEGILKVKGHKEYGKVGKITNCGKPKQI